MAYDGKILAKARTRLEQRRADNQAEQALRRTRLLRAVPEIGELEQRMRQHMTELVRLTIARAPDMKERLSALEKENLALQARKAQLLRDRGYPANWLDDLYSCPLCRDSGVYQGGVCSCLETLYNQALTEELGGLLQSGEECFEQFNLHYYGTEPENGVIPRAAMEVVFSLCREFARNFPDVPYNLLFEGGPGLGKTYLSACIARTVAKNGYSVCYDSASAALDGFEKQKFSRNPEEAEEASLRVQRMLSCDLMILDDLGTEMVTPMSLSALYTLINTRLVNGKKTIISTNLSAAELQKRYTPQIISRIEGEFHRVPFVGRDIRRIKKGV